MAKLHVMFGIIYLLDQKICGKKSIICCKSALVKSAEVKSVLTKDLVNIF